MDDIKKKSGKTDKHKPTCECPKCSNMRLKLVRYAMGIDKCK